MTEQADHSERLRAAYDALRDSLPDAWNIDPPLQEKRTRDYIFVVHGHAFPNQNVVLPWEFVDDWSAQEIGDHIRGCPIFDRLESGGFSEVVVTKDGLKP